MESVLGRQAFFKNTMMETLGISITKSEPGIVEATMPVDGRTHQPYGLLHGGASAALAESIASFGSHMLVHNESALAVGIELNINHLKSKQSGMVKGVAKIVHQGRSMHVWNIEILDEDNAIIALSRLTVMIKRK